MAYRENNKSAWEEAFHHRKKGWGDDLVTRIKAEPYAFLDNDLIAAMTAHDLSGKTIAQFCCNNGRELLSLVKSGAKSGVGFDIAENMISYANQVAQELQLNCSFFATDILAIDDNYHDSFDYIFITIGALTWFQDLRAFFHVAARCLKPGGFLMIHEMHPFTNMLAMPGEDEYDISSPANLIHSYFRSNPWIETGGMDYMSDPEHDYHETFTSFSHTFAEIINAITSNHVHVIDLKEFDHDLSGSFKELEGQGIPLSYILVAKKSIDLTSMIDLHDDSEIHR
jgi:ubiquinone/menaquinone biosynthesis C-methylase UbiE